VFGSEICKLHIRYFEIEQHILKLQRLTNCVRATTAFPPVL